MKGYIVLMKIEYMVMGDTVIENNGNELKTAKQLKHTFIKENNLYSSIRSGYTQREIVMFS
jgi:hypothetical protein